MKLKKLIAGVSALVMTVGICGMNALAVPNAGINASTNNIYVEGKIDGVCSAVTLTLKDGSGAIQYIAEIDVDENSKYSKKFKFNGDYSACTMYVNDGAKDITDTVVNTVADKVMCIGEVDAGAFTDGQMTVNATVENRYDNEGKCKLIYSFYDEGGALISVLSKDVAYDYYSGEASFTEAVPENTYKAKVYMWQSETNMIPLATPDVTLPEKDVILIGDSLGQGYAATSCKKGWGEYIGNYMANGANVINECHAGWDTVRYIYDSTGWEHSKSYIGEGDIVIFGLGYNDYVTMGYNGKYCTEENGVRTLYKYKENTFDSELLKTYELIDNTVTIPDVGTIKYDSGINNETSKSGAFTYLYEDGNGELQSYAADNFYDNMKIMLDDCKELGAEVIIRNVAAICSKNAQDKNSSNYYGYRTQAIINEKCDMLEAEYDNVTTIDLFTETKNHFAEIYNNASDTADYFFDADGNKHGYIRSDGKLQQLADAYWLTIKNYAEFYNDGVIKQNASGTWGYERADGSFLEEDTLHYNAAGADYIASAIAKLAKASDSPVNEYFK